MSDFNEAFVESLICTTSQVNGLSLTSLNLGNLYSEYHLNTAYHEQP